ncbi:deoxyguanosinetriphosphate triphosphohydrolase family protein [Methanochimaera problematica]|uniref:deoxyguanosinetriphosphate triphosphohydrolase family protein n=1 Tax=Methanochimaera problematica TaxID=2609417 RepID=UPI002939493B|nr:HD domain-containing protein [Methanoplanus sp. FWC-SCC4]
MNENEIINDCKGYVNSFEKLYSPFATRDADAIRRHNLKKPDIRTNFSRDSDRIIHSRAFARYIDKTQVFYLVKNDHITHRSLHVQLVSKIARTIGRALHLNEDLIEAISAGHDIGHPPYGHTGEEFLSDLCLKNSAGKFRHSVQSIQFLEKIENTDLSIQVLDGIVCHNGEKYDTHISPQKCGSWKEFDERVIKIRDKEEDIHPMTPEGCVVRFADTVAYIGRDIQDAKEVGLIQKDHQLPESVSKILGNENRDIVNMLIMDLISNSDMEESCSVSYSEDVSAALNELKEYNYEKIYNNPVLTSQKNKIKNMYECLFSEYLKDLEYENKKSKIYTDFLNNHWNTGINSGYAESSEPPEIVRDFIAGMTDNYFESRFYETVIPSKVEGRFGR